MEYSDSEGKEVQRGGGGIEILPDGTEVPVSEEQLIERLTDPEVEYKDDGSVWVYWFDQKIDITDKFENDICYIQLANSEKTLYMTIKYQDGYMLNPNKFSSPSELG